MGLTFRKSIRIGGLRLNLSRAGVGVSAGVRGARLGVNAKGRGYVDGGRGGFRYRATLGGKRRSTAVETTTAPRSGWPLVLALAAVLIAAVHYC